MTWLTQLHWREPLWLLLLLLPGLTLARRRRHAPDERLSRFADPPLLQWLLIGDRGGAGRSIAITAACTLAALAAAGPYWLPKGAPQGLQRGADVVVIVDISPSMAAADIAPTRLDRVKHELRDFVALLGGDRLGLVAFSANAYPVLPLTTDHNAFLHFVDLLDPSLTERPGSNLARALEVAGGLLRGSTQGSSAMVLLSDGEYHDRDGLKAARRLAADGVPLFTVGVGTEGGAPVPGGDGHFLHYQNEVVISHLDRRALQNLAAAADGAYVDLRNDDGEWRNLVTRLRERTRAAAHAAAQPPSAVAIYPWLLAASLMLFVWSGLQRRNVLALWLLPILLTVPSSPVKAAPWDEQRAYDALQRGDYQQAQRLYGQLDDYAGQMGQGVATYRLGEWQSALTAFHRAAEQARDDAQKAWALYNAGNALAQLRRFKAASDDFRAALRLQPNFAKAGLNLSLVNQFLDARGGEQPNQDKQRPPSLLAGTPRHDSEQLDRQLRGADRRATSDDRNPAREPSSKAAPSQSPSSTRSGADEVPQGEDPRLQQALALWHDDAARGGDAAELGAVRDDSAQLLRYRFLIDDRGSKALIIEGKPW